MRSMNESEFWHPSVLSGASSRYGKSLGAELAQRARSFDAEVTDP
jgi:hypothetical protein